MIKQILIQTHKKEELINITDAVSVEIEKFGIESGMCIIFSPHTTCGIIINENADPTVCKDIITGLNQFLPHNSLGEFRHAEGNSPAHIKTSLVGQSQIVFLENSSMILGTWQGIFLAEFDGPRERKVIIKVIKE